MSSVKALYQSILESMVDSPLGSEILEDSSVFAIFSGGNGQDWRLSKAPWECYTRRIFVAGTRDHPLYTFEDVLSLLKRDGIGPGEIRFQGFANHTKAQADWFTREIATSLLSTKHLVLSTARYHLPRCTLTFIKSWLAAGHDPIPITLVPTVGNRIVDSTTSQSEDEEIERIALYQQKGDVASTDEYLKFIS